MIQPDTVDPGLAEVRKAASLLKDLFAPDPRRYWIELACTGTLAWAAAILAVAGIGGTWGTVASVAVSSLLWHRASVLVHELAHQPHHAIPGVHLAWNVLIGIPWMFPSVFYEGVHSCHHRRTTYGTAEDPEYLQLAGRPWFLCGYIASALVLFPLLAVRFLILTPLSWASPRLQRLLFQYGSSYVINPRFARQTVARERHQLFLWGVIVAVAWWTAIAVTVAGKASWRWLLIWYAIHSGASLVNRLRMMTAHHFRSGGHSTDLIGQVRDSIDHPSGWWAEVWAPVGLRYHALHHLFPTLPFHAMRTAYRRLNTSLPQDSMYRSCTEAGWSTTARELLRTESNKTVAEEGG